MKFLYFQSVNFSSSYGNLSFKKHGFFRKKNWVFIFFSRNNHLEKNCLQNLTLFLKEPPVFFIFQFSNLKSDVWRYRLDNTYTRFRALGRFCFPDPQFLFESYSFLLRSSCSKCANFRIVKFWNFRNFNTCVGDSKTNQNF